MRKLILLALAAAVLGTVPAAAGSLTDPAHFARALCYALSKANTAKPGYTITKTHCTPGPEFQGLQFYEWYVTVVHNGVTREIRYTVYPDGAFLGDQHVIRTWRTHHPEGPVA